MKCKFCPNEKLLWLSAEGGLGGGTLKNRTYDDKCHEINKNAMLCEECGRITLLNDGE